MQTQTVVANLPAIVTQPVVDVEVIDVGGGVDDGESDRVLDLEAKRALAGYKATVSRLNGKDDSLSEKTREAAKSAIAKLVGAFPELDGTVGGTRKGKSSGQTDEQRATLSLRAIRATITRKLANGSDVSELRKREQSLLATWPDLGKKSAEKTGDAKVDLLVLRAGMRKAAVANKAAIDQALRAALGPSPTGEDLELEHRKTQAAGGEFDDRDFGVGDTDTLTIEGTAEVVEADAIIKSTFDRKHEQRRNRSKAK